MIQHTEQRLFVKDNIIIDITHYQGRVKYSVVVIAAARKPERKLGFHQRERRTVEGRDKSENFPICEGM
ncbi:hypothetical protein [Methylomonas albis]|uniref:hypothetical protein n=1 Tax=Methylomonas albis TaxID=1854563 RepID=UPI001CAA8595|nr:hypothetical protein [Methylomonas albis]